MGKTGENGDPPETDPDTDPDDDDADPPYVPPTKEDHARMVRALASRKRERDAARKELAEARKGSGKEGGTDDGGSGAVTSDPDAKVKRLAGIAALAAEGMTREQARAAVRLLDLSSVEVDEDGDADLDDEVADLKRQFPSMFPDKDGESRPRVRPRTSGGRTKDSGAPKGSDERHTDSLLRQAGYR